MARLALASDPVTVIAMGFDLVEIERVRRLLDRHDTRALNRLLTDAERSYCIGQAVPARHVAVRLAAKEAAYKAFQIAPNARAIGWRDSEIIRGVEGRPEIRFHGLAATTAAALRIDRALVSLSHTDSHAGAVVMLLQGEVAIPGTPL